MAVTVPIMDTLEDISVRITGMAVTTTHSTAPSEFGFTVVAAATVGAVMAVGTGPTESGLDLSTGSAGSS